MPSRTDTDFFTDSDQLGDFLKDMRVSDQRVVSSRDDAKNIVDEFRSRDSASPWTSLDRADVADRLAELVDNPRLIKQGALNLCGPATFLCIWNGRDPVGFVNYATELYDNGTSQIGSIEISPSQELLEQDFDQLVQRMGSNPTSAADWMVLGAIRNSTNVFWQGTWRGDPDQQLAALTRPEELAEWVKATGIYASVHDEGNWVSPAGIPHAVGLPLREGVDIALLIHMNLINAAENKPRDTDFLLSQFPNHYVMLLNEVVVDVQTGKVRLSIWTWADNKIDLVVPRQEFVDNYYGAVIATLR